jgi:hypothetical protein
MQRAAGSRQEELFVVGGFHEGTGRIKCLVMQLRNNSIGLDIATSSIEPSGIGPGVLLAYSPSFVEPAKQASVWRSSRPAGWSDDAIPKARSGQGHGRGWIRGGIG